MSPVTLYKRQKEIVEYISQYIQKSGTSPTLTEIADAMNLSSLATVHEHLQALVKKGVIRRFEGAVRGIEILDEKISANLSGIELSLVGYIAAGRPIEAIQNPTETIVVSPDLVSKTKRCYVLQVKGDSMIKEGIFDGDYVVIQQQETAENGDIVVALLDNGFATLKSFYKENNRIRLQPANDSMDPIYVLPSELKIQGKVTGVIRKYN
ncbi:repressor LexA [candidate division WWE3 bacterium RIFCSPLOWO2_12_FULL_36_10]|uniref:LexA repressor n=1 Tax=candidate division WWE3 bacterium RIFCSPLOWO2_12_FULL_36_10 TaxID=1802630 RepID=A0A1F4VGN8_UNCKA|nr:MAG: repressor LexA [candidate division WWE3 bacterium RIFCSPLOWO2_12_FULL_36_10]